ncbi:hypothetical protein HAX54_023364 [Datura stramonium]|uniref:Uncharacterized protein n=1 Tax=Datura stramonium TaxID=4076 RepID=A0ABS8UW83_DATST|nr:hypothetical protein [Datura stramonium]
MSKWISNLNHLTYVDDTIIIVSAYRQSLELVMDTLVKYKKMAQSGLQGTAEDAVYMFKMRIIK